MAIKHMSDKAPMRSKPLSCQHAAQASILLGHIPYMIAMPIQYDILVGLLKPSSMENGPSTVSRQPGGK